MAAKKAVLVILAVMLLVSSASAFRIPVINIDMGQGQQQDQQQNQEQQQQQSQEQEQEQRQEQQQSNIQIVNIPKPEPQVKLLDVGPVNFTRLVFPNEAITVKLHGESVVSVKAAYPIAVYSVDIHGAYWAVNDVNSKPTYDQVNHKFVFGSIVPVDQIPYYTTKGSFSTDGEYLVVDNRNEFAQMNLVEIVVEQGEQR